MNSNPLRQYFRRPAVYLRLPSGENFYPQTVVEPSETGELPVYPMTAIDEITVKTPDALFNGEAIAEIIKSCLPNIKDPWAINNVDLDAILLAIRASSSGDKFEIETKCPSCKEETKFDINLPRTLASIDPSGYKTEMQINELVIKFKPLSYREINDASLKQFEIQKIYDAIDKLKDEDAKNKNMKEAINKLTSFTMDLIANSIQHIKTPTDTVTEKEFILDFLQHCDRRVYIKIRDHGVELRNQTSVKPFDIKCPECEHQYKQPFTVNYSDFFE